MVDPVMLWCQRCGHPVQLPATGLSVATSAVVVLRSPRWPPCPSCGSDSFANCKPVRLTAEDHRFLRQFRIAWPSEGLHG